MTDRELSMAQLLIESMESDWDPERYHDTHREKVEALIEEKRSGHEIVHPGGARGAGQGGRPHGGPQRQHRGRGQVGEQERVDQAGGQARPGPACGPGGQEGGQEAAKQPARAKTAPRRKAS